MDAVTKAFSRAVKRARAVYEAECVKEAKPPSIRWLVGIRLHDLTPPSKNIRAVEQVWKGCI